MVGGGGIIETIPAKIAEKFDAGVAAGLGPIEYQRIGGGRKGGDDIPVHLQAGIEVDEAPLHLLAQVGIHAAHDEGEHQGR